MIPTRATGPAEVGEPTTMNQARTRRSPDGMFASVGGVRQAGGSLPIYVCNTCEAEVVWAESRKTGKKYLANIFHARNGGRFYVAASLHDCAVRLDARDQREREEERNHDGQYQLHVMDEHDLDGHLGTPGDRCHYCVSGKRGLVWAGEAQGGWVHPDIREGNEFARREREQETAAYKREMSRELEMFAEEALA